MHYNSYTNTIILNVIIIIGIIIIFTINHFIVFLVAEEYPLLTAFVRLAYWRVTKLWRAAAISIYYLLYFALL